MSEAPEEEPTSITVPLGMIILIVALAVPVWMGYSEIHRDERENARAHHEQIRFTNCLSPDWSNASTCLKEAVASEYDQTAEYYDLKAQQDMAKWSLLMFGITAIGVGYIAMTLHATRSTLDEAAKATEATKETVKTSILIARKSEEARFLVSAKDAAIIWSETDFSANIKIEIENIGSGPATSVFGYFGLEARRNGPVVYEWEALRWAYQSAGQREIPPWTYQSSVLRAKSHATNVCIFGQRTHDTASGVKFENRFDNFPVFVLHVFFEWTDTFDEQNAIYIALESFNDGETWSEVERTRMDISDFAEIAKYPY